ncbi:MAG: hypothetical protein M3R24_18905 [Chloroflexota bacterium]|nr:hypothetical protein [Chloroflexota bacterium]
MQQMFEQCKQMLNGMMGSSGIMNGMTGGMLLPTLVNIFVIALVVVSIMLLVRLLQNRTSNNEQTAYTLLAERFARGDIGLEEDQERRSVLQGH